MAAQERQSLCFTPLTLEHIPHVMHIEHLAYPEPWTYTMFRQEIDSPHAHFFLMFQGDVLAGYGGFWMLLEEAHITRVTIAAPCRGQGLSKPLMVFLLDRARACGADIVRLEVRENNRPALRLYAGLGFTEERRRIGYYRRTDENAIVMNKVLRTEGAPQQQENASG